MPRRTGRPATQLVPGPREVRRSIRSRHLTHGHSSSIAARAADCSPVAPDGPHQQERPRLHHP
ncbi:hypothetical protein Rrhod_2620 [Rhodococcus rhodnii LMG 5362]|uniref:Uncharacterized protein n=1 Tax=Rhodococcus rhodnii LMG 5362 TaxID=1273125 RepID=R7WKZ8_9NOCA|nr:hypothetical protein Rrhod_2620 [Rhodococcus rhodnii LMG 5362]